MTFRDRLLATLRAIRPVLDVPGVMVAGSEVPNLLEHGAAATLVVSQDVDIAVPIASHTDVKTKLPAISQLIASVDEPSVWIPRTADLIEVNFIGIDPSIVDPMDTYELADERLPLMVFGPLSLLVEGAPMVIDGLRVPVPRPAGLVLEKLVSDRTGEKGDRDLLVVAGLLAIMGPVDHDELLHAYNDLPPEMRDTIRASLSMLALLEARFGMPDPRPQRRAIAELLTRLEPP